MQTQKHKLVLKQFYLKYNPIVSAGQIYLNALKRHPYIGKQFFQSITTFVYEDLYAIF